MTLNRRQFLGSALPIVALAVDAKSATLPSATVPDTKPAALADNDSLVLLVGDSLPRTAVADALRFQALLEKYPKPADGYLSGGVVAELEAKFSAMLGKEDTVFMPTGTMANHIAVRLLCGEAKHALAQQESHMVRDESNCITTLSGINLVPLATGRAAPTLSELSDAINRAEIGPYPIKVGAIALESPVRRAQGGTLPASLVADIAKLARAKGIPMHLDGARLFMMCGTKGFDVKQYCQNFETVYVSLYKYFGAPFGAVLSGPKTLMTKARELRHIFGGTLSHGWQAALPALDALDGAIERFAEVHAAGERLLQGLEKIPGFTVQRIADGSNIALLELSPGRQTGWKERLQKANIQSGKIVDGKLQLNFNESLLRRDTAYLLAAMAG